MNGKEHSAGLRRVSGLSGSCILLKLTPNAETLFTIVSLHSPSRSFVRSPFSPLFCNYSAISPHPPLPFPITHCPLPITHYPLPIIHCPLSIILRSPFATFVIHLRHSIRRSPFAIHCAPLAIRHSHHSVRLSVRHSLPFANWQTQGLHPNTHNICHF